MRVRDAALRRYWAQAPYGERLDAARDADTRLDDLAILSEDGDWWVRAAVAENRATSDEMLVDLVRDLERNVRSCAATSLIHRAHDLGDLSADLWRTLIGSEYVDVRRDAAQSSLAPPSVLAWLARDREVPVRERVAENPNTPPEVLARLACDIEEHVRAAVAYNVGTSAEVLAALADDAEASVRECVVELLGRTSTWRESAEQLKVLAAVGNPAVRSVVVRRGIRNLPVPLIEQLANDDSVEVRAVLVKALPFRDDLPEKTLWRLHLHPRDARINEWAAKSIVLRDPEPAILSRFATDDHEHLWEFIARNPKTPADVLARLAERGNEWVRRRVSENPTAPADLRARLIAGD